MSKAPRSPSAPPDESEHDDAPDADSSGEADESLEVPAAEDPSPDADGSVGPMANRKFWLAYGKDIFDLPRDEVVFDLGHPIVVASGEAAGEIVDSKSFKTWSEAGVKKSLNTRNIIKIRARFANGTTKVGFYVTFQIQGRETNDPLVLHSVHKTIAKKLYDKWKAEWSDVKKEKFAELLADEPSEEAQINPERAGWDRVARPDNMLYKRPKKDKKPPETTAPAAKKARVAALKPAPDAGDDDDAQSSAAQSTALVVAPPPPPVYDGAGSFGPTIYTDHPDTIKLPVALYEKMAAAYYSQLAAQHSR
jgi:hypothetical protein